MISRKLPDEYFWMSSSGHLFVFHLELFEEFFAGSHPGEDDFDLFERLETGEMNRLGGKIQDSHRFAHIEDEDLAAFSHRAGLHHKLGGFRDSHEISHHL